MQEVRVRTYNTHNPFAAIWTIECECPGCEMVFRSGELAWGREAWKMS